MSKDPVVTTDEKTIILTDEIDLGEEPTTVATDPQGNTGQEVEQESAAVQMSGQQCGMCKHTIDPSRRGAPRCTNNCFCSSGGCSTTVTEAMHPTTVVPTEDPADEEDPGIDEETPEDAPAPRSLVRLQPKD